MRNLIRLRVILGTLLVLTFTLATFSIANAKVQTRSDTAIKWIARTLNRLGEPSLAKQLLTDYRNGRIRFVTSETLEGDNAQISQDSKGNYMELNEFVLQIADQEKILGKSPYGPKSINLIMVASTVVHEYMHMTQVKPALSPKFEDPAWQNSDKNYVRWYRRLRDELEAAKKLPVSAERTRQVSELIDLLNRLGESAAGDAAELPGKFGKSLSKGLKWNLLSGLPALILKTAADGETWLKASEKSAPVSTAIKIPKGGAWVLIGPKPFAPEPRTDYDHMAFTFTISPGAISGSWHRGDNATIRTSLKMAWSAPPALIEPGKQFSVTFTPSDSGSTAGAGGFLSAATALYFIPTATDPWQFLSQARPAYAEVGQPMKPHVASYTAPQGKPGNMLALNVNAGTSLLAGWGYNYMYEYKAGP